MISDVPVSFEGKVALMDVLVVEGVPLDVIDRYCNPFRKNWTLETSRYP